MAKREPITATLLKEKLMNNTTSLKEVERFKELLKAQGVYFKEVSNGNN